MKEFILKNKLHFICIFLLIILVLINLHNFLDINELPMLDHTTTYFARSAILKESISEYDDFIPLWNPFLMSGTPFLAYVNNLGIDSMTGILTLMFDPVKAIHLNYLLNMILAALSMYLFVFYITKRYEAAFIAGIVYSFSGPIIRLFYTGSLTQLNGFFVVPLIFLFLFKAFKEKEWLRNAVFAGLLLGLIIRFDPDLKIVLFTLLLVGWYLIFQVIFRFSASQIKKVLFIGLVLGILTFGLSAQKILPGKEFIDMTSRADLSFKESASRKTEFNELFSAIIEPLDSLLFKIRYDPSKFEDRSRFSGEFKIGLIAFILLISALILGYKKKDVLFFGFGSLFILSLTTGTFVYFLLWKFVPPFDSFRYLERIYSLFAFTASVLAGIGFSSLIEYFNKKQIRDLYKKIMIFGIIILVLLDIGLFNKEPVPVSAMVDLNELIKNNEILDYINKDTGIFRTHVYETTGIDWTTEFIGVPYGQQGLYGEEGTWLVSYMNVFLGVASREKAKFWGILNVKYITSTTELNITGFNLIKRFDGCKVCPLYEGHLKAWGPYLYENEQFLPRAFFVNNSILVVGTEDSQTQIIYGLMLDPRFDPKSTVIIREKRLWMVILPVSWKNIRYYS